MKNHTRFSRSGRALGLVAAALLAAAVSSLPAGIGNLGRKDTTTSGSTSTSSLSYNPTIVVPVNANELVSNVRDRLVAKVNDPNSGPGFTAATLATDPADPNSNSFTLFKVGGDDVGHMTLCEHDSNIDNIGVSLAGGRATASLNSVTSFNSDGNLIVSITTLNHGTFSHTFTSGACPAMALCSPGPGGVNAQIVAAFSIDGFVVKDDGTDLTFRLPGDFITAIRASATDTGVVTFCVDLGKVDVPATGPIATFLLVILLTGSAVWMLRRDAKARLTRP